MKCGNQWDVALHIIYCLEERQRNADLDGIVIAVILIDMSLFKQREGEDATQVSAVASPISLTIPVTEDMAKVPSNVKRTFYLPRVHEGQVTLMELTYADGAVTFSNDLFSEFGLTYVDKEIPIGGGTVATGDSNGLLIAGIAIVAMIAAAGAFLALRRMRRDD